MTNTSSNAKAKQTKIQKSAPEWKQNGVKYTAFKRKKTHLMLYISRQNVHQAAWTGLSFGFPPEQAIQLVL